MTLTPLDTTNSSLLAAVAAFLVASPGMDPMAPNAAGNHNLLYLSAAPLPDPPSRTAVGHD